MNQLIIDDQMAYNNMSDIFQVDMIKHGLVVEHLTPMPEDPCSNPARDAFFRISGCS